MNNIGDNRIDGRVFQAQRRGVTIIELFAAIFVLAVPLITFQVVAARFGKLAGISAVLFSGVASVTAVILFYRWGDRLGEQEQRELDEKYPSVFRVTALPTATSGIVKAEGAEIEVGDFGWEAESIHSDGLTYLHGLTKEWCVVWYAGFRPDQIEKIGPKPRSQYYLPYSWRVPSSAGPPCPYPVQSHETTDLGNPVRIIWPHVQGKRMA